MPTITAVAVHGTVATFDPETDTGRVEAHGHEYLFNRKIADYSEHHAPSGDPCGELAMGDDVRFDVLDNRIAVGIVRT